MKHVKMIEGKAFTSRDILRSVCQNAQAGANIEEVRRRVRLLDALDTCPKGARVLVLEDADHAFLAKLISSFQFGVAHRELLEILEAVNEAEIAPPLAAMANGRADAEAAAEAVASPQ